MGARAPEGGMVKKINKFVSLLLVLLVISVTVGPAMARAAGVPDDVYAVPGSKTMVIVMTIGSKVIKIDNIEGAIDAGPEIKWDRTFAPISPIINALGGTIDWNAKNRTVTIVLGKKTIVLMIGKNYAWINENRVYIDANRDLVPYIQAPGRTMLPVRFIAEQLGAFVMWNPSLQRVTMVFTKP